jgi:hypothetical protein
MKFRGRSILLLRAFFFMDDEVSESEFWYYISDLNSHVAVE